MQAAAFITAVNGFELPDVSLQQALRSGEVLCDLVNVFLAAAGMPLVKVTRTGAELAEGQAAQSRLRAKQLENIAQYVAACLELGIDQSAVFAPEDLCAYTQPAR